MTKQEAVVQIKTLTGGAFTDAEIAGLDGCTQQQLEFIIEGWRNIGKVLDKGTWSKIVDVLGQVGEWVQLAANLAKVIAAM